MISFKQTLKKIPPIRWLVRRFRHARKLIARYIFDTWAPPSACILEIVRKYCEENPGLTFVQIGANTGEDQFEVLRILYKWQGVMVEPQKDVFQSLVSRSAHLSGIRFENAAISGSNTTRNIYKPSFSSAEWATSLATFDRAVIEKHISNGWIQKRARETGITLPEKVEDFFMIEEVRCLTLARLLSIHKISRIDLLIIDTEGHDFEIIKQLDFETIFPDIIVFENKHLPPHIYRKCVSLLRKKQYHLFAEGADTLARKSEIPPG